MWFLLFVVGLIGLLLCLYLATRPPHPKYPPGPTRWPIVGNLLNMDLAGHWGKQFSELCKKHGKICSFKFGQFDYVILSDPVDIKELLSREEAQGRPRYFYIDHMMKFENAGILMSEGQPWKDQRRFCLRHLRDYGFGKSSSETLILDEFKELIASIRPAGVKSGEPWVIELDKSLNASTANVIWWMLANKRVTAQDKNFNRLCESFEQLVKVEFLAILSYMPSLLAICPSLLYGESKLKELRETVFSSLKEIIDEHENTLVAEEPRDLIDSLLIERQAARTVSNIQHLTDTMLIVTLIDLFNAGHETTATSLRWFYLYMMQYPAVQAKIQAEIDQVIGRDREPKWEDHARMHYTVAALNEMWRMANVVSMGVDHKASSTFECGGYVYPKDTCFLACLYGVHMDPTLWGDPAVFRPERHLDSNGHFFKSENLMPFEIGKRQCMGESLARIVTFLGAVYILQLFTLRKVEGEEYTLEPNLKHSAVILAPFPYKVMMVPRQ